MAKRFRRPNMHTVGSFFSTDAGGRPGGHSGVMGQTDGVPWSVNIPGFEDFLGTISTMQVPSLGIFTPWGKLVPAATAMGLTVAPLSAPPDTNILTFELSQVAQLLSSLGFGQPNFLAYISTEPLSPSSVRNSLAGTPYELFDDGLAVFDQSDGSGIPRMLFLYWVRLRDPGDTTGGAGSLNTAAQSLGATLVFAQQVPVETSSNRQAPTANVQGVAEVQYPIQFSSPTLSEMAPVQTMAPAPVETAPAPAPVTTASVSKPSLAVPFMIGVGCFLAAAAVGKKLSKGKGRG